MWGMLVWEHTEELYEYLTEFNKPCVRNKNRRQNGVFLFYNIDVVTITCAIMRETMKTLFALFSVPNMHVFVFSSTEYRSLAKVLHRLKKLKH